MIIKYFDEFEGKFYDISGDTGSSLYYDSVSGWTATSGIKKYIGLISQSGTSAPTVRILENTLGNVVWVRDNIGEYRANLDGAFTNHKTIFNVGFYSGTNGAITRGVETSRIDINQLKLIVDDDDILNENFFEIIVYK